MSSVTLQQIFKHYDGVEAVRDFTLEMADGEFVVLVGPSGCGKSTVLRMIAGLEDVSSGVISIGDRVVNDVNPRDRDIAMVFQNYALYPHMTVKENMSFALRLRRTDPSEIERRVRETSRMLGIEELLDRRPKALSGGQRQRVAMGRAIVREPEVFLFDEPLSNLDAQLRVEMRREIIALHRRIDATMVYVTHDQVEAMTLGDRIVIMRDGRIEQADAPERVFESPRTLFVAGFIGTPPMNLFRGIAKDGVFEATGFALPLPPEFASASGEVVLGLRPRDLSLTQQTEQDPAIIARLDFAEMLGDETIAHFVAGDHAFRVSLSSRPKGDEFRIFPRMSRCHIFSAESGISLRAGGGTL